MTLFYECFEAANSIGKVILEPRDLAPILGDEYALNEQRL